MRARERGVGLLRQTGGSCFYKACVQSLPSMNFLDILLTFPVFLREVEQDCFFVPERPSLSACPLRHVT